MLHTKELRNLPPTKYDHLCLDCPLEECDVLSFKCLVRIALRSDTTERERIRQAGRRAAERKAADEAEYHRRYKITWRADNHDRCRKYGRDYRERNLKAVRNKQRESYRRKNNVPPERYRPKVTPERVLEMRGKYASGISLGSLALEYGLKEQTAYDAITGRTWKDLPLPDYSARRRPNRGRHVKRDTTH